MGRGLDLILSGRIVEADEALAMGLLTEVVPPGKHLERALEMAEGLASFPQETMLADRRAAIEGFGLPLADGIALEAEIGSQGRPHRRRRRGPLRQGRGSRRLRRRRLSASGLGFIRLRFRFLPLAFFFGLRASAATPGPGSPPGGTGSPGPPVGGSAATDSEAGALQAACRRRSRCPSASW